MYELRAMQQMKKVSAQRTHEIEVHGLLLWASLGFLAPLGVLLLRISNTSITRSTQISVTNHTLFYYFHLLFQVLSVVLSTTAAVMSIKSFENSFNNDHQRLGLVLYIAIWAQAVLGFSRPHTGSAKRGAWYVLHWLLGTALLVAGIINTYTGLTAYQHRTSKSAALCRILFTLQVSFTAAFYLFQDKWDYICKHQPGLFWNHPITNDDNALQNLELAHAQHPHLGINVTNHDQERVNNHKRMLPHPCPKANALRNLF